MDLILKLYYQLEVLRHLLERMHDQLAQAQGEPTLEEALALSERIHAQFKITDPLIERAHLIGETHKPTMSLN